jgi:hypothetical protein
MSASTNVSEIVILESLRAEETRTGSMLRDRLTASDSWPLPVSVTRAVTVADLFRVVGLLTERALAGTGAAAPILHLEIHGDEGGTGLVMASGEPLSWGGLGDALRPLNVTLRNSLILVLGVCSGVLSIKSVTASPFERVPFCHVVGPDKAVKSYFLPYGFHAFYTIP